MSYRVKVTGPSITGVFGCDIFIVNSPTDVADRDGVLVITTVPFGGAPEKVDPTDGRVIYPARKPTGPSVVAYPRGGWDRVVITQILEGA